MLDLAFLILMIIVAVKANRGVVDDLLCNIALVIGILAGIFGLIQAFFGDEGYFWVLNIVVMVLAVVLKRAAQQFAKLYNQKREEIEEEYRKAIERHSRDFEDEKTVYTDDNFDDPNIRFGGGTGNVWNGK